MPKGKGKGNRGGTSLLSNDLKYPNHDFVGGVNKKVKERELS